MCSDRLELLPRSALSIRSTYVHSSVPASVKPDSRLFGTSYERIHASLSSHYLDAGDPV